MIEILFSSGIALAVYMIFANVSDLRPYADIFFWVFIAILIVFGVVAVIKAVFEIKDTVKTGKSNARKKK